MEFYLRHDQVHQHQKVAEIEMQLDMSTCFMHVGDL